jgi:hypothetical protein
VLLLVLVLLSIL